MRFLEPQGESPPESIYQKPGYGSQRRIPVHFMLGYGGPIQLGPVEGFTACMQGAWREGSHEALAHARARVHLRRLEYGTLVLVVTEAPYSFKVFNQGDETLNGASTPQKGCKCSTLEESARKDSTIRGPSKLEGFKQFQGPKGSSGSKNPSRYGIWDQKALKYWVLGYWKPLTKKRISAVQGFRREGSGPGCVLLVAPGRADDIGLDRFPGSKYPTF